MKSAQQVLEESIIWVGKKQWSKNEVIEMMQEYAKHTLEEVSTRVTDCISDEEDEIESSCTRTRDGLYIANGVIHELINQI